jgi:hypothetical protein
MSSRQPRPRRQPRPEKPPQVCGHCGGSNVHWHCANPACTWGSCVACRRVTDLLNMLPREDQ